MLGYISKEQPECLRSFHVSKQSYGLEFIWFLHRCQDAFIAPEHVIPINESLKVYKFRDEIDQSLICHSQLLGKPFQMGDNQQWHFPQLRKFPDGTDLHTRLTLTEHGDVYKVKPHHLKAWNCGDRLWQYLINKEQMQDSELYDILATVMNINYDLTVWDIRCYGLIDSQNLPLILAHLLDFDTWKAHLSETDEAKKNF